MNKTPTWYFSHTSLRSTQKNGMFQKFVDICERRSTQQGYLVAHLLRCINVLRYGQAELPAMPKISRNNPDLNTKSEIISPTKFKSADNSLTLRANLLPLQQDRSFYQKKQELVRSQAEKAENSIENFVKDSDFKDRKSFQYSKYNDILAACAFKDKTGHPFIENESEEEREYIKSFRSAAQSIRVIQKIFGNSSIGRMRVAEDISREISGDYGARKPELAPVLWKDVESKEKNPFEFAIITYAYYRMNGMLLSDLHDLDPYLYKKFTNWCYYRKMTPKEHFEEKTVAVKETISSKAVDDGFLLEEAVKCPKKSEIGKTITEIEFRHQRRLYENQLSRIRRRRKTDGPHL